MKTSLSSFMLLGCLANLLLIGCGSGGGAVKPMNGSPVKGTVDLENLTPEQKIQKIQNDPKIPEQYKQTYINSVKAGASGGAKR